MIIDFEKAVLKKQLDQKLREMLNLHLSLIKLVSKYKSVNISLETMQILSNNVKNIEEVLKKIKQL